MQSLTERVYAIALKDEINLETKSTTVVARGWGVEEVGRWWSKDTNFQLEDE